MSRGNRRERREREQQRALAHGDPAALGHLAEKSKSGAAAATLRALQKPPAAPEELAALDALAAKLAGELRREGELDRALALAAAGRRRTPALRMEEAACAFAAGKDEIAAEIAGADAAVTAAVGPLLAAVRGEDVKATAAPALRALHAAGRAAAATVRGEVEQARSIVGRIPLAARGAVFAQEIVAATHLGDADGAGPAIETLARTPALSPAVLRAMCDEAAFTGDPAALPELVREDPALRRRSGIARLRTATSVGAMVEAVRLVGVDSFDPDQRGAAALYDGFARRRSDPAAAMASFDRAVQLGGDLLEALRGEALTALTRAHPQSRQRGRGEVGAHHDAASAHERLAHALARATHGAPLAAVAEARAATEWLSGRKPHEALAALARARPHASSKLILELDLLEARAIAFTDPRAAERRVDAVLARARENVAAWQLKLDLVEALNELERRDAVALEAADATHDPGLEDLAREVRGEDDAPPFARLAPGTASAGALARELARTTSSTLDSYPLAAEHRAALGPGARLAFDAAAIAVAGRATAGVVATARLREVLTVWRGSPSELARLVAVAVWAGGARAVPGASAGLGDDVRALRAVADALAVAGKHEVLAELLPRLRAGLSRAELDRYRGKRGAPSITIPGVPDPEQAVREVNLALAPEFTLEQLLAAPRVDEDEDEDEDEDPLGEVLPAAMVRELMHQLGVPRAQIAQIPEEVLRSLGMKLIGIALEDPMAGPASANRVVQALAEVGIHLPPLPAAPQRGRR